MVEKNDGFPRDLLEQPAAARVAYFKRFTMAHPLLKEAYETLRSALHEPAGTQLILVMGPAGVGKTTLRLRVEQKLTEEMLPTLAADPGRLPVVGVEAIGPDADHWNWKDYYKRLLMALHEPLLSGTVPAGLGRRSPDGQRAVCLGARVATAELRQSVEHALGYRRPVAVFVDEAQHLTKVASGRKLQDQLDCVKSLANMTRVVQVLVGSYELLAFRNLSGQLSRRSLDVHFRRYRANDEQDAQVFRNVLRTFQQQLPLREEPDLVEHWSYLYECSIGCVGVLKDWLARVLATVLEKGREAITVTDLEAGALSVAQCEKMVSEAIAGETVLAGTKGARARLQSLLGLKGNDQAAENRGCGSPPPSGAPSKKRRAVGVPNPQRYPIGGGKSTRASFDNL